MLNNLDRESLPLLPHEDFSPAVWPQIFQQEHFEQTYKSFPTSIQTAQEHTVGVCPKNRGRNWWFEGILSVSRVTMWELDKWVINQKLTMAPEAVGKIGQH